MSALSEQQTIEVVQKKCSEAELGTVIALLSLKRGKLDWLLRDHTIDKRHWVTDWAEIDKRNALDAFLGAASALEVVRIATGRVPPLPSSLHATFFSILNNNYVREYFQERYPLGLPTLFYHDLVAELPNGLFAYPVDRRYKRSAQKPDLSSLVAFFELDGRLQQEEALGFFLDLLDDYNFEGICLDDILEIVSNPKSYEEVVVSRSRDLKLHRLGLQGLESFIAFSIDLKELLDRLDHNPLLRAAIWLHFCYWFGNGGEGVRYTAGHLLKSMKRWEMRGASKKDKQLVALRVKAANRTLRDLTNWKKYAQPLIKCTAPLLDGWAAKQLS